MWRIVFFLAAQREIPFLSGLSRKRQQDFPNFFRCVSIALEKVALVFWGLRNKRRLDRHIGRVFVDWLNKEIFRPAMECRSNQRQVLNCRFPSPFLARCTVPKPTLAALATFASVSRSGYEAISAVR